MKIKRIVTIIAFIVIGIFIILAVQQLQTSATLTKDQMTAQVENVYKGSVQSFIEKDHYFVASFEKNGSIYEVQIDPFNGELSNMQAIFIKDQPIVAVKDDDGAQPSTDAKSDDTGKSGKAADTKPNEQPVVTAKPVDPAVPNTNSKPSDTAQPDSNAKPSTTVKPDSNTKPTETTKPNTNTKPSDNTQKPPATKPLLSEAQATAIAFKEVNGKLDSIDYEETPDGGYYIIEIELDDEEYDEAILQVHAVTGKILSIQFED
ncbi:MAG: PepSY domain-containing protein [Solibacillus sp.]